MRPDGNPTAFATIGNLHLNYPDSTQHVTLTGQLARNSVHRAQKRGPGLVAEVLRFIQDREVDAHLVTSRINSISRRRPPERAGVSHQSQVGVHLSVFGFGRRGGRQIRAAPGGREAATNGTTQPIAKTTGLPHWQRLVAKELKQ